ncbi:hypothetical protein ACQ5SK_12680 [Bradyrhizobium japonicum]
MSQLANDRIVRDREINVWTNTANGLGLNASAGLTELSRQTAINSTEARQEIEGSNAAVKAAADAADAAKAALDALTKSIAQQESARTAVNTELERIRKGLTTLRSDPRLSGVTLDSNDGELNNAEHDRLGLLDELRQSHDAATQEQTRLQGLLDAESRILGELAGQLPILRRSANENEQARKAIIARLADAGLPEDSDEQELLGKLGEETQALARLRALHQRVASAEIGLDAATTAAALARLESTIATKKSSSPRRRRRVPRASPGGITSLRSRRFCLTNRLRPSPTSRANTARGHRSFSAGFDRSTASTTSRSSIAGPISRSQSSGMASSCGPSTISANPRSKRCNSVSS